MKKLIVLFWLFYFLIILSVSASADLIEIDFNELLPGEVLTDQYFASGVTVSLLDTPPGYVEGPVANTFDSTKYPQASPAIALRPGDDVIDPFYDIIFSFEQTIDYFSFWSFDSDEIVTVKGYRNGTLLQSQSYGPGRDYQAYELVLGAIGGHLFFDTVIIDVVAGPGAIGTDGGPELFDNLSFNTASAPVPVAAFTLLLGLD
ncbi:MAG: hypothetical protein JRF56_02285 [Deltaproteobacteria bacterium]|jgi:hypothetical protein|nr:hypothetical protein [Deltaproteobacteria bacterium]